MNQKDFFANAEWVSGDKKVYLGFFPDLETGIVRIKRPLDEIVSNALRKTSEKKPVQLTKDTGSPFSGVKVQIVCEKVGLAFVIPGAGWKQFPEKQRT